MLKRTLPFLLFLIPVLAFAQSDGPTPEPADVVVPGEKDEQPVQAQTLPDADGEAARCSEEREAAAGLPAPLATNTAESWNGERSNRSCPTTTCERSQICDWYCGGVGMCIQNCCQCV